MSSNRKIIPAIAQLSAESKAANEHHSEQKTHAVIDIPRDVHPHAHHHHHHGSWSPGKIFRVLTKENDWKTNASFIGEIFSQSCNSYEVGEINDYIVGMFTTLSPYFLEISEEGFWIFVAFAIFTSVGAAVCHLAQNYHNQDHHHKKKPAEIKEQKEGQAKPKNKKNDLEENLLSEEEQKHSDDACEEHDGHQPHTGLRWYDWVFLAGDAVAHTIENTSPIVYTVNVFFTDINSIGKGFTLAAALSFGVAGCYADVRSCYRFLKTGDHDHEEAKEEKGVADRWTNFASFADVLTSFIKNPVFLGKTVDAFGGYFFTMTSISDFVTVSGPGLGIGLALTTVTTISNAITHNRFNTNCQHAHQVELDNLEKGTELKWKDKTLIAIDFVHHTFNFASSVLLVDTIYKDKPLSRFADCATKAGFFVAGGICSIGTSRTCKNQTKRFIFHRDIKPKMDLLDAIDKNDNMRAHLPLGKQRRSPDHSIELPISSSKKSSSRLFSPAPSPVPPSESGDMLDDEYQGQNLESLFDISHEDIEELVRSSNNKMKSGSH